MKSLAAVLVAGLLATGCASDGPTKEEFEAIKRRVAVLEKKAKAMEPAKGKQLGKPSQKDAKAGKAAPPKTGVKITGDAEKVMLTAGKRRVPVPGQVAPGEYVIHALFAKDGKPVEAGKISIKPKKPVTIDCSKASSQCSVAEK